MIGIIRFFLASCVVVFHLTHKISHIGWLAVNFFYVISGFLITLILNETYKFNFSKFSINRFLRLYPIYFSFAALTIIIHFLTNKYAIFHPSWSGYLINGDVVGNVFILPWSILEDPAVHVKFWPGEFLSNNLFHYRLIPSTWSIAVELVCYFILWFFTARNIKFSIITLFIAIFYHIYMFINYIDGSLRYLPFPAAMLSFSLGSIAYFINNKSNMLYFLNNISTKQQLSILFSIISIFILNWYGSITTTIEFFNSFYYYFNNIIAMISIIILFNFKVKGRIKVVNQFLGDLSYPIFLGHYIFGYIGWHIIGTSEIHRGWKIFFVGYILNIIGSAVLILLIDYPIKNIREKIKAI